MKEKVVLKVVKYSRIKCYETQTEQSGDGETGGVKKRKGAERSIRKRRMDLWLGWRRRGKNEIFNCS